MLDFAEKLEGIGGIYHARTAGFEIAGNRAVYSDGWLASLKNSDIDAKWWLRQMVFSHSSERSVLRVRFSNPSILWATHVLRIIPVRSDTTNRRRNSPWWTQPPTCSGDCPSKRAE
jgi:hypothetical protein